MPTTTTDFETRRAELIAAQADAYQVRARAEIEAAEARTDELLAKETLLKHLVDEAGRQCHEHGTALRAVDVRHWSSGEKKVTRLWIEVDGFDDKRIGSVLELDQKQYLVREIRNRGFASDTLYVIEGGDQVDTLD